MVATLVEGLEIDFARTIIVEIHERALKTSTTYYFPFLVFKLCKDTGVQIWHYDRFRRPSGIEYISLIRDEANVAEPRKGTLTEVPPLRTNFGYTNELAEGTDPDVEENAHPTPASSSHAAITALILSRSTPPAVVLVSLAQV